MWARCMIFLMATASSILPEAYSFVMSSNMKHKSQNTISKYPQILKIDLTNKDISQNEYKDALAESLLNDAYPDLPSSSISSDPYSTLINQDKILGRAELACSLQDVIQDISITDLDNIIQLIANSEGIQPTDIIKTLAQKYELHFQD